MTSDPLDRATRLLRDDVADVGDVEALPAGRDAAVARLADALRARARARQRRRRVATFAIAASVGLSLGGGTWLAVRAPQKASVARSGDLGRVADATGALTALRDGHSEPVSPGARMAEGTELRTSPSSEVHLDFDSGTRLTLSGSARVRLVEQNQRKRFALEAGSLFAKVAKLGPDERFVVATSDAEVEVRGTLFNVSIVSPDPTCAGGTSTRVDVTEGVVVVRHAGVEQRVSAGERWPICESHRAAAPLVATGSAALPAGAANGPSTTHTVPSPAPEVSSRLAEQNDLFAEAMRAKRGGDLAGALATLDRLRSSYPTGPLAESAAAERMRILATTEPARARAAAREYLSHHPRGFARTEAEALTAGPP